MNKKGGLQDKEDEGQKEERHIYTVCKHVAIGGSDCKLAMFFESHDEVEEDADAED